MGAGQGRGRGAFRVGRGGCAVGVVVGEGCLGGRAAPRALAHDHEADDAGQAAPREDLGQPLPRREVAEEGEREGLDAQLGVTRDQREEQNREGDHDEPVGRLDPRAPLEFAVGEGRGDDAPRSFSDGRQAPRIRCSRCDGTPHVRQASPERDEGQGADQQGEAPHDGAQRRIGHVSSSGFAALHCVIPATRRPNPQAKRAQLRADVLSSAVQMCSLQRGYAPPTAEKYARVRECFPSRSQT